eukprot:gene14980-10718_t
MFNLIPSPATTPTPDDPDKHKYGFFMVLIIAIGIPVAGFGSTAVTFALGTSPDLEPIYYLIIYLVTFFVQLRGGNLLWNIVVVCSIVTIFPVILFLFGAFLNFDYNKYARAAPNMYNSFPNGDGFMRSAFFGPSYLYIGVEMLPQVCNHVRDPNVTLPRGMYYGCILGTVIALLAVVACAGLAPGYGFDFVEVAYPMDQILLDVFGIPTDFSDVVFVLSSQLLCVFSLMYSSGHQMGSLAKSGLLPAFMTKTYGPHQVPYKTNRSTLSVSGVVGDTMVVMFGRSNFFGGGGSTHASLSNNNSNGSAVTMKSKAESMNKKVAPAPPSASTPAAIVAAIASATATATATGPAATEVVLVTAGPDGHAVNLTRVAPLPANDTASDGDGNALTFVENDTVVLAPPTDVGTPMSTRGGGPTGGSGSTRKSALRASWNVKQQNVFGMSNKSMSTKDSQKFMEIILCHGDQPPEKLLSTLATEWPDQFVVECPPTEPV